MPDGPLKLAGYELRDRSMVLETIHGAKVLIFLMGWIYRVGKYPGIKAAAIIEVLAFPSGLTIISCGKNYLLYF